MTRRRRHRLPAGVATGIGSLPHADPAAAAATSLRLHPELPAAPELPNRSPAEGITARWLDDPDGVDSDRHAGFLAFVKAAAEADPAAVKAQVAGPLTLGLALLARGVPAATAFDEAADVSARAARTTLDLMHDRLPHADPVLFLDEPALVVWSRDGDAPLGREEAVDLLSGVLAGVDALTGVHVCGDGDPRMAIEAGPDVVGFPATPAILDDAVAIARYLDGGGWVAWGAVPTDGPVGERADHWWNELAALWCDLTRAGCDPVTLRTQSLITPACGLAGHTEPQAERILEHTAAIGEHVREQAIATRLSVGA